MCMGQEIGARTAVPASLGNILLDLSSIIQRAVTAGVRAALQARSTETSN